MKKISILAIAALFVMLPVVSFAKTAISDSDLETVVAEAGVNISFNYLTVGGTVGLSVASWGDSDGFGSYTNAGFAGINAVTITGNLTTLSGTANLDIGTSGSTTSVGIIMPTVTLGTMNAAATLNLSTAKDLSGGNVLGLLGVAGFSTQMTGALGVYAH